MNSLLRYIDRKVRTFLGSRRPIEGSIFSRINFRFERARFLVSVYYVVSAYLSYAVMPSVHHQVETIHDWRFLWPIRWIGDVGNITILEWFPVAAMVASLLAFQFPAQRIWRILFALFCLFITAAVNSHGGISHGLHLWLWIGVCFVLLPGIKKAGRTDRATKVAYLSIVAAAEVLQLLFYSMAGFLKVLGGVAALFVGTEGNFAPRGLALQLADRMLQTGTTPLVAHLAINWFWLSWLAYLALIYIQFVSVAVAFRPRLHAAWGYLIILFHLGTWLLMEIAFSENVLFAGLMLVMSPFKPQHNDVRKALCDLPGFGVGIQFLLDKILARDRKRVSSYRL